MNLSVLAKAKTFSTSPYPYICIENVLPTALYDELEKNFPEDLVCSTPALDEGITYRYKSNPVLFDQRIAPIWRDFFIYHTSADFFHSCIKLFEPYLEKNYPILLESALRSNVTIRNIDNSGQFISDCQFVVHEPIGGNCTSRTPHLDNPVEIYAGLLYMRNPLDKSVGGNLVLHGIQGEIDIINKRRGREVGREYFNPIIEVPYSRNTFCMFLNVKNSVHSVTPRIHPTLRRRSVNIICEFNNNGAMWNIKEAL